MWWLYNHCCFRSRLRLNAAPLVVDARSSPFLFRVIFFLRFLVFLPVPTFFASDLLRLSFWFVFFHVFVCVHVSLDILPIPAFLSSHLVLVQYDSPFLLCWIMFTFLLSSTFFPLQTWHSYDSPFPFCSIKFPLFLIPVFSLLT